MRKVLVPPPATKADEIVAAMGGTFYSQEAPHLPRVRRRRARTSTKGDPLYIIEVMKMFNKVYAPFAGTITAVLVDTGTVVRKGQPLFKIQPDEVLVEEDPGRARAPAAHQHRRLPEAARLKRRPRPPAEDLLGRAIDDLHDVERLHPLLEVLRLDAVA